MTDPERPEHAPVLSGRAFEVAWAAAAVGLTVLAFALARQTLPAEIEYRQDEHNLVRRASALWFDGRWPHRGPAIAGTRVSLGAGYIWLLALCRGVAGSFSGALVLLAGWMALAVPVWVVGARRVLGLRAAVLMGVALATSPLLHAELARPLLHAHYGVLPASVAWVATLGLARGGGGITLVVAAAAAAFSTHFHLTWTPMLAVVAWGAWRARARLDVASGVVAVLVVALVDVQVLADLGPATFVELLRRASGEASYSWAEATAQVAYLLRDVLPGGLRVLGAVVLGTVAVAATQRDTPAGLLARTAALFLVGHAALFGVAHGQWFASFYTSTLVVALACAVAAVTEAVAARWAPWIRVALAGGVVVLLVCHALGGAGRERGRVALSAWNEVHRVEALADVLAEAGFGRDALLGDLPRVHGLPCRVDAQSPCPVAPFLRDLPAKGTRTDEVRVVWPDGWPALAPVPGCVRARGPRQVEVDCGEGSLLLVLWDDAGPAQALREGQPLALEELALPVAHDERAPRIFRTGRLPLDGVVDVETALTPVDVMVGATPWTVEDLGWTIVRPADQGPSRVQ
ncbi:MAG: hypothetical protein H6732_07285 [Alphaproteobacteria bacterium]|nr:hypothetical protein [Alphaproteobacteria bacterium]